jgi:glycolate oxidase FAD binding subunit
VKSVVSDSRTLSSEELDKFKVDGMRPKAVVVPETIEEVATILKRASEFRVAVTPWGGGTMMSLGGVPKRIDVVILLCNLNRIVEYLPEDLVVTAEAGISLENLQTAVARKNQFVALDPPYASIATLGGIAASNSFGPICYLYGRVRDLMLGVKVANSDGSLTSFGGKVVKNVAGYDIKKLYIGSLGTLGIIVHTTFKLHPMPGFEATLVASFESLENLTNASREVLGTCHSSIGIGPSAVEGFDPNASGMLAGEGFDIPQKYALALRVMGITEHSTEERILELTRIAKKHESIATFSARHAEHELLWNRIREYPKLSSGKYSVRCKVSTLISRVGDVMDAARKISQRNALEHSIVAHVGLGILHIYLNSDRPDQVCKAVNELRDYVLSVGSASSLVIEAAPLSVKQKVDAWGPVRKDFFLMQAVKNRFDPKGILNPGRFIGGI